MIRLVAFYCLGWFAVVTTLAGHPDATEREFFEAKVRPLLAVHCYECHSSTSDRLQAGLLLDSRQGLVQGGDSGAAIVPGDADGSLLIEAVRYESYEMPPKGKLTAAEIEAFEQWIERGAPWPQEESPAEQVTRPAFDLNQRQSDHWVWDPISPQVVPSVTENSWPRSDLDRFILSSLERAGLHPSRDVDRNVLARRLYFDLIGLPPDPAELAAFLADDHPDAIESLVDRLLQSPHFGERWGRHWLDLVRYAESRGHEFDDDARNAYQYRDYVIRAFNADVPYDQWVREHIAGDLLDSPRLNPIKGYNESILGTGFWFLGEWVHSPVDTRKDETDRFDNMIDVMSKTFLGITVACARCHDHKFDAISTADYYALSGFLQSSDYRQVRFESLEHNRKVADALHKLDAEMRQRLASLGTEGCVTTDESEIPAMPRDAVLVDYSDLGPHDFIQDGFLFGDRPRHAAQIDLDTSGATPTLRLSKRSAASSDPFWNGLKSISGTATHNRGRLSKLPRSGRTLRTPTFTLDNGKVAARVRGRGHVVACVDSHRLIAGPLHGETVQTIEENESWLRIDLSRYVGHRLHLEFTPAENASLEVSCIVQNATPEILKQIEEREQAIEKLVCEHEASLHVFLQQPSEAASQVQAWTEEWANKRAELKTQVQLESHLAMAMVDGTGEDDHLLIRGSSKNPGDLVPRRFLTALVGDSPEPITLGSGRLDLAHQINDPENPLTSRVIVNRIWHHLMGRGIVPTTDDFGVLGERPTHPELLDHLAASFRAQGQSIKRMIRQIVLSRTYQMSSHADPMAIEADPNNQLWHHRPPKRLESEAIRDSLLAVAGTLDRSQFGESIPIHLTAFMEGRGRPSKSGPVDGDGRRSIYTAIRRNFLSPFQLAFDMPVPFSNMGRRNVSNVPAQALILMNDPFVKEQAEKWAQRALVSVPASEPLEARIRWMYQTAFARNPTPQEIEITMGFLTAQSMSRGLEINAPGLWSELAHALVNSKEFIFLK
ncbi:PSD1 and planctomycete cytochrome C domain-containing protein [Novipirellula artificiosorum]|nr:PSD1 and planctomycete cytochrome C domain-containing protein [Novipirellula artificiosorum]